jgi:CDP-diacylglycerol pyrophosphatase
MTAILTGACALLLAAAVPAAAADPDTLWHIVHDRCVPHQEAQGDPAPCALVDLRKGYVVLKDIVGATQFLVMPTERIDGIESPEILAPGARNYMADAWAARRFVAARAGRPLAREDLSLAVNSVFGRTQNQLHIHVDCLKEEVRGALARQSGAISNAWMPLPERLGGRRYLVRRLLSPDLDGVNPFVLLAESSPGARARMGDYTLVISGETFEGRRGFVLLADRADLAQGDRGAGEALQDHACALARR